MMDIDGILQISHGPLTISLLAFEFDPPTAPRTTVIKRTITMKLKLDRIPNFPGTFSPRTQEEYLPHVFNTFTSPSTVYPGHRQECNLSVSMVRCSFGAIIGSCRLSIYTTTTLNTPVLSAQLCRVRTRYSCPCGLRIEGRLS